MTMSTHANDRLEWTTDSSGATAFAGNIAARAHLSAVKRFFAGVLVVLLAGTAAAGVVALKTAYYLSHFSY